MADVVDDNDMPAGGTEDPTMKIIQILKTVMLSLQLTNEKCFQTLFIEGSYLDSNCLKLVGKPWDKNWSRLGWLFFSRQRDALLSTYLFTILILFSLPLGG